MKTRFLEISLNPSPHLFVSDRKFSLKDISRDDVFSANRETERETKIPFITDVMDERAKVILNS